MSLPLSQGIVWGLWGRRGVLPAESGAEFRGRRPSVCQRLASFCWLRLPSEAVGTCTSVPHHVHIDRTPGPPRTVLQGGLSFGLFQETSSSNPALVKLRVQVLPKRSSGRCNNYSSKAPCAVEVLPFSSVRPSIYPSIHPTIIYLSIQSSNNHPSIYPSI